MGHPIGAEVTAPELTTVTVDPGVKGPKQGGELSGFLMRFGHIFMAYHLGAGFPISHKVLERQGLSFRAIRTPVLETDREAWLLRGKAGPS